MVFECYLGTGNNYKLWLSQRVISRVTDIRLGRPQPRVRDVSMREREVQERDVQYLRISFYVSHYSRFFWKDQLPTQIISPANSAPLQLGIITDTDLSMLDNLDILQTINNGYLFLNH